MIIIITIIIILLILTDACYNFEIICYKREIPCVSTICFYSFFLLLCVAPIIFILSHYINSSLFEMFVLNSNNSALLIKVFLKRKTDFFIPANL